MAYTLQFAQFHLHNLHTAVLVHHCQFHSKILRSLINVVHQGPNMRKAPEMLIDWIKMYQLFATFIHKFGIYTLSTSIPWILSTMSYFNKHSWKILTISVSKSTALCNKIKNKRSTLLFVVYNYSVVNPRKTFCCSRFLTRDCSASNSSSNFVLSGKSIENILAYLRFKEWEEKIFFYNPINCSCHEVVTEIFRNCLK